MRPVFPFALCFAFLLPSLSADPPSGLIAEGTRWETPFYVADSGKPGPSVVLTGGIHGDEPAGYRAAEQIRHWPLVRGRLIVIPKVNIPGLAAGTRLTPDVPTGQRNLNRNFVVADGGGAEPQGKLATEVWKLIRRQDPDWLIDLHEGFAFHISHRPPEGGKRSVGSSIIYRPSDTLDPIVERALAAANTTVTDPDRTFVPLKRGPVSGSLARAATAVLGIPSLILETTTADQPISLRSRQHRVMVNSILTDIGMIAEEGSRRISAGTGSASLQVGFYDDTGTGPTGKDHIPRILDRAEGIDVRFLGSRDFEPFELDQFDLLFFPGGSGSKQARALGEERRERIREFVRSGGGFIGVCAGAYLCSAHYSWSLDLVDSACFTGTRVIGGKKRQMWYRGGPTRVDIELSQEGRRIFSRVPGQFDVRYQNGPILSPKGLPALEDYTPLAWFRSEKVLCEPQRGTMIDTPAIVSGRFGKGRVVAISPHPEADEALESIIEDAVRWAAPPSSRGEGSNGAGE